MKFKVGDKIKAIDNEYCRTTKDNGWTGIVTKLNDNKFDAITISGKGCCEGEMFVYLIDDHFELIPTAKPTKDELLAMPNGTRVTTDLSDIYRANVFYKQGRGFSNEVGDLILSHDIENDLTINDDEYGTKIIKIEKPVEYETMYDYSTEVKEMTIADIEKALGHSVKIIKEEK